MSPSSHKSRRVYITRDLTFFPACPTLALAVPRTWTHQIRCCFYWTSPRWHLEIESIYSQGGHWGSDDYRLPVFFTILSTNYRLFNTLSTNFIDVYFQDILPWNRPGTWLSTQLDFHLKKFAHFWMWHDEEAKMGLSLYVYYKFSVLRVSSWWLCAKNLQNLQNYRLNYRLFGKVSTI